jgi:hypothetical protein
MDTSRESNTTPSRKPTPEEVEEERQRLEAEAAEKLKAYRDDTIIIEVPPTEDKG